MTWDHSHSLNVGAREAGIPTAATRARASPGGPAVPPAGAGRCPPRELGWPEMRSGQQHATELTCCDVPVWA